MLELGASSMAAISMPGQRDVDNMHSRSDILDLAECRSNMPHALQMFAERVRQPPRSDLRPYRRMDVRRGEGSPPPPPAQDWSVGACFEVCERDAGPDST
ncbi:hypothetical protein EYF80_012611 [Liparis tanakae]|uniref:Uncharacterized protein n=1 Tax=Liparis tanakae TaxID=230148 RepID=A0A4Z2IIP1_9TELE|nr:hypothetical protein EYF80_012611 [Liparis tanakae]